MMSWKRLTTRSQTFINSSIVNVEPRQQKKQAENVNKEATVVKGEKKQRTMENEQGVVSTMGSAKVAGQPARHNVAPKLETKKTKTKTKIKKQKDLKKKKSSF